MQQYRKHIIGCNNYEKLNNNLIKTKTGKLDGATRQVIGGVVCVEC